MCAAVTSGANSADAGPVAEHVPRREIITWMCFTAVATGLNCHAAQDAYVEQHYAWAVLMGLVATWMLTFYWLLALELVLGWWITAWRQPARR